MRNIYKSIVRRIMFFMLAAAFCACMPYMRTETVSAAQTKGEVNADTLNVRTGAGTNYDILKVNNENVKLGRGTKVTITEELAGGWYKIKFDYAGEGRTGYVASMYVSTVRDKTVLAQNLSIKAKTLKKTKVNGKPAHNVLFFLFLLIKLMILITIRENASDSKDITFDIQCTKTGLNAIFFKDCKIVQKDGGWWYELGVKGLS